MKNKKNIIYIIVLLAVILLVLYLNKPTEFDLQQKALNQDIKEYNEQQDFSVPVYQGPNSGIIPQD